MRGNKFGKLFSFVTFGESHGEALGVVVDGVSAGLDFDLEDLQLELDRRAPGRVAGTTNRKEADRAEVLSGVFEGKTLGTPIAVIVRNTNQRSGDYDKLKTEYRPGHADETTQSKYGIRDHRGGGRSSGRETLSRVIAGYFAGLMIPKINISAYISKMGPFEASLDDLKNAKDIAPYNFPLTEKNEEIKKYLLKLKAEGESVGGRISIHVTGVPKGLGEPAFDKLKADFAKGLLSIGACVSFSFGLGEEMANLKGSEVSSKRENFGGIEGGISNGEDIFLTTTFKPTSTIGEKAKEGRHDPCILPRAVPVVEAMVKCILADHLLRQRAYGDGVIDE
ncbi:chorismate synthase [Halobacteriovorax marinus]|uniref:chorismate synthase n=1 Tax=Halobacteriovorax marinus TaxID=97084 RepID=UPI000BC2D41F|nr:chorismate synthase [Halobacteriovorax marinus]ATH09195.1 chorismate synthase [Halobacteriovorax marinus]